MLGAIVEAGEIPQYFELTPTGLIVHGEPQYEDWAAQGDKLAGIRAATHWWIGDWINYGEHRYGETYAQAIKVTGYSLSTVQSDAYVARRYEACMRMQGLSWGHHHICASLETPEERAVWLQAALENGWSQEELKAQLKGAKGGGGEKPKEEKWLECPECGHRWQE